MIHHVAVISIRLIELYHGEFWVTTCGQALITEVPINFETRSYPQIDRLYQSLVAYR